MICFALNTYSFAGASNAYTEAELEVVHFLQELFDARSQYLLSKDEKEILNPYYLPTETLSRHALRQEEMRKQYIHAWAAQRKIQFVRAESHIRIPRIRMEGDRARVSVVQSQKLDYTYMEPISINQSFGVGTRHALILIKKDGKWHVLKEWYSDPLNENPKLISKMDENFPNPSIHEHLKSTSIAKGKSKYRRDRAVAYANKYAGAAWGAGNDKRYNKKYVDYTSKGGDCTNFASQVIGDPKEGGGLQMTANWQYWFNSGGSHTWVQTDRFSRFLQNSGYVRVIAKGTFEEITKVSKDHPYGVIGQLKPGDLIAYILHGNDVDHFGVLVGFDDYGYPLVNSHTADRHRVPFDLGWDQHTRYLLIHIRD
ncbi:amidase domain-containing protein [Cohnella sp. NL03-T5]|nr:amidase domain-containing protein [Cohnella silvisoli]